MEQGLLRQHQEHRSLAFVYQEFMGEVMRCNLGARRHPSPRSVARDVETPTLRLRTIERDIRAGKVILIINIQHGSDRERASPRLRGGPYHGDHEILRRARP